jgi:hypothetical protein
MSKPRLPPKKDVALALLQNSTVFVHLDPRAEPVRVPPWLKKQPQLVLQIGLNMPVPIPDLTVDDEGISCTLSFSRSPHFCLIPWQSIYALVGDDGRGMVWPDDVPPEVASQAQAQAQRDSKRAHLRAVPDEGEPNAPAVAQAEPSPKPPVVEPPEPVLEPAAAEPAQRKAAGRKGTGQKKPRTKAKPTKVESPPTPAVAADDKKSKRELPPYLRVVK